MKKVLFYFGHPAQFLFARNTIHELKSKGCEVHILIKSKDVLETLVKESGFLFTNILEEGRRDTTPGIVLGVLKRDWRIFKYIQKTKPQLLIGTDPALAHVGRLRGIPVITTLEDDFEVIPKLAKITYPYTNHILTPNICSVSSKYEHKKLGYNGYMKLAYLHPNYFTPDLSKSPKKDKPCIFVRLAKLTAHHDDNIQGLESSYLDRILSLAGDQFRVIINSEYPLKPEYEHLRYTGSPNDIHHVLAFADLFISDSQSMSVEAAMLGTPSIRYSDFVGRISVLEELEHTYGLTCSIKPPNEELLFQKIEEMLSDGQLKENYQRKREKMLSEKIDVTELLTDLILRYPESLERFK
ncbi:MAG: DUF354 domain-containing protein [Balneolaceae bacterium]|nr:DUF354 domain-containing protein [Balneolaceae bacterium]